MKKKYITICLIGLLLVTTFGCIGEEVPETTTPASTTPVPTTPVPTTATPTTVPPTYGPPEIKEYDIQFTAKYVGDRNFKISGTTNLPNGSKIWVTIYDEDYFEHDDDDPDWRMENLTYFADSVLVIDGKFTKTLTASELEAPLKSDKYEVEVCFNPRAQIGSIKRIVGEDGEYLGGRLVNNEIKGLTTLEISKIITVPQQKSS